MSKKKSPQQPREINPLERLGMRVSAMINSPKAQSERRVVIHRLDTDPDEVWSEVLDLLRETDGIVVAENEDDSVTVTWGELSDDDQRVEDGAMQAVESEELF